MRLKILFVFLLVLTFNCYSNPFGHKHAKYDEETPQTEDVIEDEFINEPESERPISKLSTEQIRALASINVGEPDKLIKNVVFILTGKNWGEYAFFHNEQVILTPLNMFSEDKILEALEYYDVELTKRQFQDYSRYGTILDLLRVIFNTKREGLFADQAWSCMEVLLYDFLEEKQEELTERQFDLVKKIYRRTKYRRRHIEDVDTLRGLYFKGQRNAIYSSMYLKVLNEYVDKEIDMVDKCYCKPIGHFVEAGWCGHFVSVEILPLENGRYSILVANAGGGAERYHLELNTDPEETRLLSCTVNEYIIEESRLYNIIESIAEMFTRNYYESDKLSDVFYSVFEGSTQIINLGVPQRPLQRVGNCGVRNQEELIFRILQRCDEVDLANKLQDYFVEYYQRQITELYPALRDMIEAQKPLIKSGLVKPRIEPIEPVEVIEVVAGTPDDVGYAYY